MAETSNCGSARPLIEYGGGEAPTLDYNIPQQSCISALGRIELNIPEEWFVDSAAQQPENNWWTIPRGDLDDIRESLLNDITYTNGGSLIDRRVADVVRAGEERVLSTQEALQQTTALTARRSAPAARAPAPRTSAARSAAPTAAQTAAGGLAATGVQGAATQKVSSQNVSSSRATNSRSWNVAVEETAHAINDGLKPVAVATLGGAMTLQFIPPPPKPRPRLYLIEEYRICSYLSDYGAGKTVSTISLLPGEERTITVSSYRDSTSTKTETENILDSFSQESADEFEELIETESGFSTNVSSSQSKTTAGETGLSVGVDLFGLVELGVGGEIESSGTKEASTTQDTYVDTLSRALSKHVEQSSYKREVEVNTTTSQSVSEGESKSVVRVLKNINLSRVLNFVVRQLLQKYVTITYLHSVRVVFSNGFSESITPMELYALDEVLPQFIAEKHLKEAKAEILRPYCAVFNYRQEPKRFIEKVDRKITNCEFLKGGEKRQVFYRKDPKLTDEAEGIQVPGVIKNVQFNVLRTPAVIIEGLLGLAATLDCYNEELQAAAVDRSKLSNEVTRRALDIVGSFMTPEEQAKAYRALLRDCECQPDDEAGADSSDEASEETESDDGSESP